MINFNEEWVRGRLHSLWEEMCGIRRTFPQRLDTSQRHPFPDPTPVDLGYARQWIPFSELKAARLLQHVLEDRITHVGSKNNEGWHFFNDVYHQELDIRTVGDIIVQVFTEQFVLAMDAVAQEIENQAAQGTPGNAQTQGSQAWIRKQLRDQFKEHLRFQERIHSNAGLNALEERFRVQCSKADSHYENDRRWLVCKNGVIDLEGFRKSYTIADNFRPHSPLYAVKRSIDCDFNPKAKAPNWDHFLETSIPDPEIRAFLQRLVGAAFLAESKVKAIPNLQGPKDCGKTIFVSTLEKLAGGYGIQPSPDALMQNPGGTNFEQDTLRGARFVGISEPSPSKRLDDTFCKQVTGGDEVRTRGLHQSSTPWLPQCVIFIASNQPVNFTTSDAAFLERICLIQFPHQFFDPSDLPENDWHVKDYDLERKLEQEYEGIFLWVIRGMWEYLVHGIAKPESIKNAGTQYATESSGPLSWVEEKVAEGLLEVVKDVGSMSMTDYVTLNHLYPAYAQDYLMAYDKPLGKHAFARHLYSRYPKATSAGTRFVGLVGRGQWRHFSNSTAVNSGL